MYQAPTACCDGHPRDEGVSEPADRADFLTALAREARLLEFGVEGDGDDARRMAQEMEGALTEAMDADSADELSSARNAIGAVLTRLTGAGMRLSAHLSDIEIAGGVLGKTRMPVLTAVLRA